MKSEKKKREKEMKSGEEKRRKKTEFFFLIIDSQSQVSWPANQVSWLNVCRSASMGSGWRREAY